MLVFTSELTFRRTSCWWTISLGNFFDNIGSAFATGGYKRVASFRAFQGFERNESDVNFGEL